MAKIFYTADAEYTTISGDADIRVAETETAALAALASQYESSGLKLVGLLPGRFGDCWIKFHRKPTVDDLERLAEGVGMTAEDLYVQAPGQHPGGKTWWVTPSVTVLVPVFEEVDAEVGAAA